MDLKKVIPLLCFVGVCIFGGLKLIKGVKSMVRARDQNVGTLKLVQTTGLGDLIALPQTLSVSLLPNSILGKESCQAYVRAILLLNLESPKESSSKLTYSHIPESPADCVMLDEAISASEKNYLKSCLLSNPVKTDALSELCLQSLNDFRASLTHFLLKQTHLSDISKLPELAELMYFDFAQARIRSEDRPVDYARLGSIASEMLDVSPDLAAAFRVKSIDAIKEAEHAKKSKTLKEQDLLWAKASEVFANFKRIQPGHFAIEDEEAIIETRGYDAERLLQYSVSLLQQNPSQARAYFYEAFGHWKFGDHEEAFQKLKKAIELDPKNEQYQQVLQKLSQTGSSDDSFTQILQVELTPRDFER